VLNAQYIAKGTRPANARNAVRVSRPQIQKTRGYSALNVIGCSAKPLQWGFSDVGGHVPLVRGDIPHSLLYFYYLDNSQGR